jgi:hypothetical protein
MHCTVSRLQVSLFLPIREMILLFHLEKAGNGMEVTREWPQEHREVVGIIQMVVA